MLLVAVVMTCTAGMIVAAADSLRKRGQEEVDFGAIGDFAFGPRGRTAINVAFVFEMWLVLVSMFGLIGANADIVFPVEPGPAIVSAGVLTFLLFYVPASFIAASSVVALASMVGISLLLVYTGLVMPVWEGDARPELVPLTPASDWR